MPINSEHKSNPSISSDSEGHLSVYNWQIIHPFQNVKNRVAVEIMPWRGLLSRWRFVLPSDYNGVVEWGITKPGEHVVQKGVLRPVEYGPTQLVNGPEVVWFGGHKPLSQTLAAIIVFKHPAPHYLAFGIADQPGGPPLSLEGISFVSDNTHLHSDEIEN
ncbi:MAG: hypothetical protein QF908_05395 [Dehalococcoidia bacterium]|nr:hypothetical protein [Chloroflexota bacterium]MDP6425700.1 hypothetical protein [Dehalococcoidia bacterium]MDP7613391.1 hypothetical protein [Dehalococcoidia bacterium]